MVVRRTRFRIGVLGVLDVLGEAEMRCSVMRSSRFLLGVSLGEGGIGVGSSIAWQWASLSEKLGEG